MFVYQSQQVLVMENNRTWGLEPSLNDEMKGMKEMAQVCANFDLFDSNLNYFQRRKYNTFVILHSVIISGTIGRRVKRENSNLCIGYLRNGIISRNIF